MKIFELKLMQMEEEVETLNPAQDKYLILAIKLFHVQKTFRKLWGNFSKYVFKGILNQSANFSYVVVQRFLNPEW